MRILSFIVAASLVLAVLQAGTKLILAVGLVMFGWCALTRPLQTAAALSSLTCCGLLMSYPVTGLAVLAALSWLSRVAKKEVMPAKS